LAALVTVKVVAGGDVGAVLPGDAGGGVATVVSTPSTTASVPTGEVNDVAVLDGMDSGGGGGEGGGGLGDGGGGLGAVCRATQFAFSKVTCCVPLMHSV
jgi:hypothetical protein